MIISSIGFKDFRCFDSFHMDFRPGVNLLIGDNSSGKTSLLRGVKYAMSSFFSGFSDSNTQWNAPGVSDYRKKVRNGVLLPIKQIEIDFSFDWQYAREGLPAMSQNLKIVKKHGKNSKPLKTGIRSLKEFGKSVQGRLYDGDERRSPLPLFACYSTEDIHGAKKKIDSSALKEYYATATAGYLGWFNASGMLRHWIGRLLILREAERGEAEIRIVEKAIRKVLGEGGCNIIRGIDIRPNKKEVYFLFTDGREATMDQLSDGYRRLVNIVVSLAFRASFLNRELFGENTLEQTRGIVLIDELDLHLHPSLQAKVASALHAGFPGLQIIATSHAPMVMSSIISNPENAVYRMWYDSESEEYKVKTESTYGMSISDITQFILGIPPRDGLTQSRLDELFALIDREDMPAAKETLGKLEAEFGSRLPELSEAMAMINFYMADNEED